MNRWIERANLKLELTNINNILRDRFSSGQKEDMVKLDDAISWIKKTYGANFLTKIKFYHKEWYIWSIKKNYWQVKLR